MTKIFIIYLGKNSMNVKLFLLFISLFLSISSVFSNNLLNCNWVPSSSCPDNRDSLLFVSSSSFNNSVHSQPNEFMSSHISTTPIKSYDTSLCCTLDTNTEDDRLTFFEESTTDKFCSGGHDPLIYLSNLTNAIVGINYSSLYHSSVLCADLPDSLSYADIGVSNTNYYKDRGYQCLFRVNNVSNGRVSSCSASYFKPLLGFEEYSYAIWLRVFESTNSLRCNADCTSKIDSRVYASCASKVLACKAVPSACDGSLYGGWVELPSSTQDVYGNYQYQIKCEAPWTQTRINPEYIDPNESGVINVVSSDDSCSEIISQEYSVLVYNIPYKMKVYVCN